MIFLCIFYGIHSMASFPVKVTMLFNWNTNLTVVSFWSEPKLNYIWSSYLSKLPQGSSWMECHNHTTTIGDLPKYRHVCQGTGIPPSWTLEANKQTNKHLVLNFPFLNVFNSTQQPWWLWHTSTTQYTNMDILYVYGMDYGCSIVSQAHQVRQSI